MPRLTIITAIADYRREEEQLRSLNAELDGIREALQPAVDRGICEVLPIADLTVEKLIHAFDGATYPVAGFHFAGHADSDRLLLQEDAEREGLATFLGRQSSLRFVFLNGCSSAGHIETLHRRGVPAVIATEASIPDTTAKDVAVTFYRQLGMGKNLAAAYASIEAPSLIKGETTRGIKLTNGLRDHPWQLSYKEGAAEAMSQWNLAIAAGQPLFGLPDISGKYDLPVPPYRYLERYTSRHARVFFGRGKEIRTLYENITDPHLNPILLLNGQSGVGKSSLLEAGVLPRLRDTYSVHYLRRSPDKGLAEDLLTELGAARPEEALIRWKELEEKTGQPLFVVLDQVEELFTRPLGDPKVELAALLSILATVFEQADRRPRGKILLSLRKEYFTNAVTGFSGRQLAYTPLPIQPLSAGGIEEAVAGLASNPRLKKQYRLTVEPALPRMIADDLLDDPQSPIAPVLQVLLTEMWNATDEENRAFSTGLYRSLKKTGLQLSDFVKKKLDVVAVAHPTAIRTGLALDLLNFFTTPRITAGQHSEQVVLERYRGREAAVRSLLSALGDHYLLSKIPASDKNSDPAYRLAHDTLAPIVRLKYNASVRPGQLANKIIDSSFLSPNAGLLNEQQLQSVLAGKDGMRTWTTAEDQWIKRSHIAIRRQKRSRRIFIYSLAAAGLLLIVLLTWAYRSEVRQRKTLQSQALAARADLLAERDPTRSIRLLQQSQAIFPSAEKAAKLYQLFRRNLLADTLLVAPAGPEQVAIAPGGRFLFFTTPATAATAKITGYEYSNTGLDSFPVRIPRSKSSLYDLAFSADGLRVFGGGKSHQLHRWTIDGSADTTRQDSRQSPDFRVIAPNSNGSRVATITEVGDETRIDIWDFENDRLIDSLSSDDTPVALRFAPDDQHLLIGTASGAILLHTPGGPLLPQSTGSSKAVTALAVHGPTKQVVVARGGTIGRFNFEAGALQFQDSILTHSVPVRDLVYSADGRLLLTLTADQLVHLWRLEDQRLLYTLRGHEAPVLAMGFAREDRQILTADKRGVVRAWSLPALSPIQEIADVRRVEQLILRSDVDPLKLFATTGRTSIRQWSLPAGAILDPYEQHEEKVGALACRGNRCASGDAAGKVQLWSAEDLTALHAWQAHTDNITDLALSPDGRQLVTTAADKTTYIWSVESGQRLDSLAHPGFVSDLTYGPNGTLWTVCTDQRLRIWPAGDRSLPTEVLIDSLAMPELLYFSKQRNEMIVGARENETSKLLILSAEGALLRTVTLSTGSITAITGSRGLSPPAYALGTDDGRILLVDQEGYIYHKLSTTDGQDILSLGWYGDWLISGSARGRILLWEKVDRRTELQMKR